MIRLVTVPDGVELTLSGELSLDVDSPYFQPDAIPGTASLPAELPWTRENLRGLGFPHLVRRAGGPAPVTVDLYLEGVRWQRGLLRYVSVDVEAQRLKYNFVSAAGDLAAAIKGVKLGELELGTVPFAGGAVRTADYFLPTVRNASFYGDADQAPAGYSGYVNYWQPTGTYPADATLCPMLYLLPVLKLVFSYFGWELVGPLLDDAELQTAVIFTDRALPAGAVQMSLAAQLPNLDVADLLLGVQGLFCAGYFFNTLTRQVRLSLLRDVVAGTDQLARPGRYQASTANTTTGWLLRQVPDDADELDKSLDAGWQQLAVLGGGEGQEVKAGTLHFVSTADQNRTWSVPAFEGKGAMPGNADLGDDSRVGLRLLFDRGWGTDSNGRGYPLASPLPAQPGDQYSLQWGGPQGLYATFHAAWLGFRARAVQHSYVAGFRLADLLLLDPATAEYVDYHRCLWEKVSVSFRPDAPLQYATFTYQEVL